MGKEHFPFQLGIQLTALQTQLQQCMQMIGTQGAEIQKTQTLLEALGKTCGLEWSKDLTMWVSMKKLAALKHSPLDSPSE